MVDATPDPDLVRTGREPIRGGAFGIITAGSSWRSDHGLLRRRDDGDVIDGGVGVVLGARDRFITLGGGTDDRAGDAGRMMVGGSAYRAWRSSGVALAAVRGEAGYSEERQWLFDGDVLLGPVHLAAGREDAAKAYRIGLGLDGRWSLAALRLAADRVIVDPDAAGRRLATEIRATVGVDVMEGVLLLLDSGVAHAALGNDDTTWYGAIGGVLKF